MRNLRRYIVIYNDYRGARSCRKRNYILHKQDFTSSTITQSCPAFSGVCMSWKHIHKAIAQTCLTERGICSRIELIIGIRHVSSVLSTSGGQLSFAQTSVKQLPRVQILCQGNWRILKKKKISWRRKWLKWGRCHQVHPEVGEKIILENWMTSRACIVEMGQRTHSARSFLWG